MSAEPEELPLGQIVIDVRHWMSERPEWQEVYEAWANEFFDVLDDVLGEDTVERLEEGDEIVAFYAETACLEFFLAFRAEEFEMPVDAFLAEKGDELSEEQREFLTGLRDSNFSLYHVVEVTEGSHMVVNNLVMTEDPIRIEDDGQGFDFEPGETLAGRIITVGGKPVLTAIAFALDDESRKEILEYYEDSVKELLKDEVKLLRKDPRKIRSARLKAQQFLPPICTAHWVGDRFDEEDDASSMLEGIRVIIHRYPAGPTEPEVRAALDGDDRFRPNPERDLEWILGVDEKTQAVVRLEDGKLVGFVAELEDGKMLTEILRRHFAGAIVDPEVEELGLEEALARVEALEQESPGNA